MKKVIAGFILGLACLFVFSITWGNQVLSKWVQTTTTNKLEQQETPAQVSQAEKEIRNKKLRLFLNPFDLANGLTFQDLDELRHNPNCRLFAFIYLVGALWMVRGMRKSKSQSRS